MIRYNLNVSQRDRTIAIAIAMAMQWFILSTRIDTERCSSFLSAITIVIAHEYYVFIVYYVYVCIGKLYIVSIK